MRYIIILVLLILYSASFTSCGSKGKGEPVAKVLKDSIEFIRNQEAREDSIKLAEAYELMGNAAFSARPSYQTVPVAEDTLEDAADDPAFWVNNEDISGSLVFGTNKKGGIYSYTLRGEEVNYYRVGDVNNIDIRQQVKVGNQLMDVLGGSNRSYNSIELHMVDSSGNLINILTETFAIDSNYVNEVYGFCMYKDPQGEGFAVVNGKNGQVVSYKIVPDSIMKNKVKLVEHASWKVATQPEGMVVDDENQVLYVGEEQNGIWKIDLLNDSSPEIIPSSQKVNNSVIAYDIEGLAIYKDPSGNNNEGFLLASIQGSFTYAVFTRTGNNDYITNFSIINGNGIDGVEETDGLEIVSIPVGEEFPEGILIVQDGFNFEGSKLKSQNFKIIDLREVLEPLKEAL